ncbi:MAG: tail fiber domain-containing protein [Cryomorphaceae bacterium]|nr:tail fiber domain-containing protein [Cryomorphaceae bacterium]
MAKQTIGIGTVANDGTGDPLRTAFDKINDNFTELYFDGGSYVDGTGTANYGTKWIDSNTIGNSIIYDDGTNVGIGTTTPTEKLDVVGKIALNDGGNSVFIGEGAGLNDDGTDNRNVGVGYQALYLNTTGSYNTANGRQALYLNTTGSNNTANGYQALYYNTTGSNNAANGYAALFSNTTGGNNAANGMYALYSNTTGNYNTANGRQALYSNTTGSSNVANGMYALLNNTTGSGNIVIGSLNNAGTYLPAYDITTENNRISMGSTSVTNADIQVAWTVVSDARDKTNFGEVPHGLDFVSKLKPLSYKFKESRDSDVAVGDLRYGFKAQDILELEGDNSVIINSENQDKLRYNETNLIPVLVKAIQELKAEIELLKNK